MSDVEEPPTKVTKYEMSQTFTQVEEIDEGQEEWLSEGLLTDDDFHPENPENSNDPDRTRSDLDSISQGDMEDNIDESNQVVSQDNIPEESLQEEILQEEILQESFPESHGSMVQENHVQNGNGQNVTGLTMQNNSTKVEDSNIEQTLNSMNEAQTDELDEFLMKNEGQKPAEEKPESDGNDTDDLLRMLEDDDKSKKTKVMKKTANQKSNDNKAPSSDDDEYILDRMLADDDKSKKTKVTKKTANQKSNEAPSSDDEYILDASAVKKLKISKSVIINRKYPMKAEPEDTSDDDSSLDEAATMRRIFGTKQPPPKPQQQKQLARIGNSNNVSYKTTKENKPVVTSTPLKKVNTSQSKSVLKPPVQQTIVRKVVRGGEKNGKNEINSQPEHEEIINEEEFLEEDDFDLREDFAEESDSELDKRAVKQQIMRPERMDEDMLSDVESLEEDGSLYDELPTSESEEDLEEWFTLDIRSERAADYLPLLGTKAYDLLLQEKARMSSRLSSLRNELSCLSRGGRAQADRLRRANIALKEVDDMLKAT